MFEPRLASLRAFQKVLRVLRVSLLNLVSCLLYCGYESGNLRRFYVDLTTFHYMMNQQF